ncbi:hypothetical protein DMB92_08675 [Campylobacter sp. MIT 99-7217]|uniref:metal ABC transporter permease n=1 Tax=Campylobacter sp. MIT 99-7217 TaxID=535091 RepID=UPI001156F1BF|nr:metal ABC transporter permease [Campylobacter sp. MIT 99-7217]TQR29197.1 hypothetical protein DMB92_08675 [Campylobacter sp. MIT 99-7217]
MFELLSFSFFQHALLAALLVSLACGIIGSLIMINRLFSLAGGITHAAFGGIGIAVYFALPILLSTSIFTLILAFFIAFLSEKFPHRSDSVIAVIWAFGMAFGLILIDLSPGYQGDLMAYLFGSILAVSSEDLYLMIGIDLAFIALVFCFYTQFEALSFDAEFAKVRGVRTRLVHYLLIAMICFCIVISIRVVGLILVIALLSIPCFIAEAFSKKLGEMMIYSCVLSGLFCFLGLFISSIFNLSSGACIILVACFGFFIFISMKNIAKIFKKQA